MPNEALQRAGKRRPPLNARSLGRPAAADGRQAVLRRYEQSWQAGVSAKCRRRQSRLWGADRFVRCAQQGVATDERRPGGGANLGRHLAPLAPERPSVSQPRTSAPRRHLRKGRGPLTP